MFCVFEPIYDFDGYVAYDFIACCTSMEECEDIMLERIKIIYRRYDNLFPNISPKDCSSVGTRPFTPFETQVKDKKIFTGFLIEEIILNELTVY